MGKIINQSNLMTVVCILIAAAIVWAFVSSRAEEKPPVIPPEVTVALPEVRDVTSYYDFTGTVAAVESVEIRTRLEGFLDSVEFKPSADVKKDDVLFIIEPELYQAHRDQALAKVQASQAELEKAESELQRVEQAIKAEAVSEQEVTSKRAHRDKAIAAVEASKALLAEADLQLSYTQIFTPISGRVSRNLIDAGNLVGAGENTLLTTVVTMDPVHIYFNVSEHIILERLKNRQKEKKELGEYKFYVGLSNEEGYPHEGVLDYIDNVVDPSTGTINVRGVIGNSDSLFVPGMFVRVRFASQVHKDAILVEEQALGTDIGGKYLYVVGADSIVERRVVQIGTLVDGMRVIKEGLKREEHYITQGLLLARPGMPVRWGNGGGPHVCEKCQSEIAQAPDLPK